MTVRVRFSRQFRKQYNTSPRNIQIAFDAKLKRFLKNQHDPLLRNHALRGMLGGLRSINITGGWRAIFRELPDEKIFFFDALGTHSQLYR